MLVGVSLPSDTTSADFSVRVLSDVRRDDSADEANTKATDEPANVELVKARSADGAAGLYDRTHNEDKVGQNKRPFTTAAL